MREIKKFYDEISKIKYGWYDKNGNLHKGLQEGNFQKEYRMQSISKILENKYAICWEMCELERSYFKKKKIPYKTIFALLKNNKKFPCHTFLVFKKDQKWYWLEASWERKKGIHEYNSLQEILTYFKENFTDFTKCEYNKEDIVFYEYKKPKLKMTCNLFYFHCIHSKEIK